MDDYIQVRCLFCETGKEMRVVRMIHENDWGKAIFARRIRYVKRSGEWRRVESPLLPGYVFVYSDLEKDGRIDYHRLPHVIRILSYENGSESLTGSDRTFADWLWRMNGEIGVIQTMVIGDRVEIANGVFRELHGKILHINKRQRKVCVSLETQSIPIRTWLTYEQVEKVKGGE